jgi:hypothetical protein
MCCVVASALKQSAEVRAMDDQPPFPQLDPGADIERPRFTVEDLHLIERVIAADFDPGNTGGGKRRGHGPKIDQALIALRISGRLPAHLRSSERDARIRSWLLAAGYCRTELPSRWAIARHLRAADQHIG